MTISFNSNLIFIYENLYWSRGSKFEVNFVYRVTSKTVKVTIASSCHKRNQIRTKLEVKSNLGIADY